MPDAVFEHPRLIGIYDTLEPDRSDLQGHLDTAERLGARSVLDVGCGTGTFALLLAARGLEVIGVDPAGGSLAVARAKPGAGRVRWLHRDASALPPLQIDLATMTANVAQAIAEPTAWASTLLGVHAALRPGGHLVLETRDPADRAWEHWTREETHRVVPLDGVGTVETWTEVTDVTGPLVTFATTWVFARDGAVLTSTSTLRFRERVEVEADLIAHGFVVDEVSSAPDRSGREIVVTASR